MAKLLGLKYEHQIDVDYVYLGALLLGSCSFYLAANETSNAANVVAGTVLNIFYVCSWKIEGIGILMTIPIG